MKHRFSGSALAVTLLSAALLLAPVALATSGDAVTAEAPVHDKTVTAGAEARFPFTLRNNDSVFDHTVRLTLVNESGAWLATVDPAGDVTVPKSGTLHGNVTVQVPADASPGAVKHYGLVVEDRTNPLAEDAQRFLNFTVRVAASDSQNGPRVTLTADATALTAVPGEQVQARARAVLTGATTLLVEFAGDVPEGWSAANVVPSSRVLYQNRAQEITLTLVVPEGAAVNESHLVLLRATAKDGAVTDAVAFSLTVQPPPEPPEEEDTNATATGNETAEDDANATSTDEGDGDASTMTAADESAPEDASGDDAPDTVLALLSVHLTEPTLVVAPGEAVVSTVEVTNPGERDRTITLQATLDDGWVLAFEGGNTITVPAGETRVVGFSVTAPTSATPGESLSTLVRADEASAAMTVRIAEESAVAANEDAEGLALANAPAPTPSPMEAVLEQYGAAPLLAAAGAVTAAGGAIWLRGAPHVRRNLWWVGIGAYTRLTRPKLLDHEERERLYRTVEANPGIHFHALQRELQWNTGALTYHLRVLERHQMVVSRRDGILRRFYLVGTAPRTMPKAVAPSGKSVTLTGIRGSVMTAVQERGRVPQAALVDELGTSKQALNYHVKNLERMGLLRVERAGRETILSPMEEVEFEGLDQARAVAPNATTTAARPGLAAANGEE